MSALLLDEAAKQRAHEIVLFAARPENWYRPGPDALTPGERPELVADFQSYRCVFSYTSVGGVLLRHLSISLRAGRPSLLPHPFAAFTIASWFGFTGGRPAAGPADDVIAEPGDDWACGSNELPVSHLVLQQRIGPAAAATSSTGGSA